MTRVRALCRPECWSAVSTFQSNDNQFLWELIGGPPKTRNVSACWQDGRFFAENETWVVDSCTKCTCKVSRPRSPGGRPSLGAQPPALRPQDPSPLRGTLGSSLRSPAEGEGHEGFPPPPEKVRMERGTSLDTL